MTNDVLAQVGTAVRIGTYRRLSPLQTLRLSILELLEGRDRRQGHWSIARSIHNQLEDTRFGADSAYLALTNQALHHLKAAGLINLLQSGVHIRSVSITDRGRSRLRTLLELEQDNYQAFLREVKKL